jgi:hypothetical protein
MKGSIENGSARHSTSFVLTPTADIIGQETRCVPAAVEYVPTQESGPQPDNGPRFYNPWQVTTSSK